jgi:ribosome-associated protein
MSASTTAHDLAVLAATAASDKFATDIVALDVSEHMPLTDVFVMATGRSERMVQSIANEVDDRLTEAGYSSLRKEGHTEGRWILLDFGHIIVHVFHEEERLFYQLERLWRDCPVVELPTSEEQVRNPEPELSL